MLTSIMMIVSIGAEIPFIQPPTISNGNSKINTKVASITHKAILKISNHIHCKKAFSYVTLILYAFSAENLRKNISISKPIRNMNNAGNSQSI